MKKRKGEKERVRGRLLKERPTVELLKTTYIQDARYGLNGAAGSGIAKGR